MKMTDVYGEAESSFLKAKDLQIATGKYRTMTVTIEGSEPHECENGDKQLVLSFKGEPKKWGMNKTCFRLLSSIFGSDASDDWIGKTIELYVDKTVRFKDSIVHAIRPREAPEQAGGAPADELPPSDEEWTKERAWAAFSATQQEQGKAKDAIAKNWRTAVAGRAKACKRTEADFTSDDWADVAGVGEIPF